MESIAIIVLPQGIMAYGLRKNSTDWEDLHLSGEQLLPADVSSGWLMDRVFDHLDTKETAGSCAFIVIGDDCREELRPLRGKILLEAYNRGFREVINLPLEPILQCAISTAESSTASITDPKWCRQRLMPVVRNCAVFFRPMARKDEAEVEAVKDAMKRDLKFCQDQLAELMRENTLLRAKIDELERRIATPVRTSSRDITEIAVYFLPLFFRNFWEDFSPSDVAQIVFARQPISVPSPFPEPSPEALEILRREFEDLPPEDRAYIKGVVRRFVRHARLRPEMQKLLED